MVEVYPQIDHAENQHQRREVPEGVAVQLCPLAPRPSYRTEQYKGGKGARDPQPFPDHKTYAFGREGETVPKRVIQLDMTDTDEEGHAKVTINMNNDGTVDHAYFHDNEFRGFEKF